VIVRKSQQEIEGMARAGELVAETIALLGEQVQPGVTTDELDRIAEEFIREHGGVPTSKGYRGFPAATCISPNTMVVHGIPGGHRVEEGDLISVDVGITLAGLVADFRRRRDRSRGRPPARGGKGSPCFRHRAGAGRQPGR